MSEGGMSEEVSEIKEDLKRLVRLTLELSSNLKALVKLLNQRWEQTETDWSSEENKER